MTRFTCYKHLPLTFASLRAEGPSLKDPLKYEVLHCSLGTFCWVAKDKGKNLKPHQATFTVYATYPEPGQKRLIGELHRVVREAD